MTNSLLQRTAETIRIDNSQKSVEEYRVYRNGVAVPLFSLQHLLLSYSNTVHSGEFEPSLFPAFSNQPGFLIGRLKKPLSFAVSTDTRIGTKSKPVSLACRNRHELEALGQVYGSFCWLCKPLFQTNSGPLGKRTALNQYSGNP